MGDALNDQLQRANDGTGTDVTILEALKRALSGLVNLQVVTVVGEARVTGTAADAEARLPERYEFAVVTNMNMLTGDIVFIQGRPSDGDLKAAMEQHEANVARGQEIMARNILVLKELYGELRDLTFSRQKPR